MSAIPSLLSAQEIKLSYGSQLLLNGVTLTVAPGEKVGLVGRNGCGKTSLLRLLSGMYKPQGGRILLDGTDITKLSQDSKEYYDAMINAFADAVVFTGGVGAVEEETVAVEIERIDGLARGVAYGDEAREVGAVAVEIDGGTLDPGGGGLELAVGDGAVSLVGYVVADAAGEVPERANVAVAEAENGIADADVAGGVVGVVDEDKYSIRMTLRSYSCTVLT